jgi:3-deoxy-manno-octulosonate cytidylyltransferase (CMP-KDO synthetase)
MNYVIIIPARYESSRLPGKPLVDLCGVPMVVRTYRQCIKVCPGPRVHVATDDVRVQQVCADHAVQVLMTSSSCLTGTDRVAECAARIDADVFINVQGDEPVFAPDDLRVLIAAAERYPGEVLNGVCDLTDEQQFRNASVPKVVMGPGHRLLYMSRAPIPTTKGHGFVKAWRQVCAYAFPRAALQAFAGCQAKMPLEAVEDIEILRFLELGWGVRMVPMSSDSIAVDTPADVDYVRAVIARRGL